MGQIDMFEGVSWDAYSITVLPVLHKQPGTISVRVSTRNTLTGDRGLWERHWMGAMPELLPALHQAVSEAFVWGEGRAAITRAADGIHQAALKHQRSILRQMMSGVGEGRQAQR